MRSTVVLSLQIELDRLDDGTWIGDAPWMNEATYGQTYEEVIDKIRAQKPRD